VIAPTTPGLFAERDSSRIQLNDIRYAVFEKDSKFVNYDLDQEDIEDRCSMAGADLTDVAEKELKDESEDAEPASRFPQVRPIERAKEPRASVLLLRGSRLLPRVRRYVEEGEGERVGKVQTHSHTLSRDHRNWTRKFYGFGFLPSPAALAEGATGLGFQKFGSALIHSSCT